MSNEIDFTTLRKLVTADLAKKLRSYFTINPDRSYASVTKELGLLGNSTIINIMTGQTKTVSNTTYAALLNFFSIKQEPYEKAIVYEFNRFRHENVEVPKITKARIAKARREQLSCIPWK